jgi:hypothetical protein
MVEAQGLTRPKQNDTNIENRQGVPNWQCNLVGAVTFSEQNSWYFSRLVTLSLLNVKKAFYVHGLGLFETWYRIPFGKWTYVRDFMRSVVLYEGVSKSFRTGRLERELQMLQLSATRCSCIAILWVSLVSFAAIILCVDSQRVFIVVVYFVIDWVRKLLDTLSYKFKPC